MNFIVSSSALLRKLQVIGGIVNNNSAMPILENFLFELTPKLLTITATDLETTMVSTLAVETSATGSVALPARQLTDILKTFPEQPLTFSINNNHTLEISSAQGKYALAYSEGEEFPKGTEVSSDHTITLLGDILGTAISKTIFATGNDDMRPVMSGVFFQLGPNGFNFVATDAHKLVKYERLDLSTPKPVEFIMPKKPLNLLKNILSGSEEEVSITHYENNVKFVFEDTQVICRLVDGKYPNYEAVIPTDNPNKLTINRNQLLSSVRRVAIFSNKTTHQIRLKIAGAELNIYAEDLDFSNKAEERLTCSYIGDDMQIGFNSRFLAEMLANLESEEIQIEMSLPNRAGILSPTDGLEEGEKITMIVMPVMIGGTD